MTPPHSSRGTTDGREESDLWRDALPADGVAPVEFIGSLSHELRNPLAPMRSAIHALEMISGDVDEVRRAHAILDRQLSHMSKLLDDLLDLCRLSYGTMTAGQDHFEAGDLTGRAVNVFAIADGRSFKLELERPDERLWLRGDLLRLSQALAAVLDHGATRTPDGATLYFGYTGEEGGVAFRIRDPGPSIASESVPHLFDLFSKVAFSPTRRAAGCGLGLPLARRVIELHGGHVDVSAQSGGLEISVWLPEAQRPTGAVYHKADAGNGALPQLSPRRILIVDDNVDAAESLALVFSMGGHAVEKAHDGPAALAAARTHLPEAVLLDIGMPGMDGYEVARRMRGIPGMERALIIAVTGFDQKTDRERSREAGIDWHLVKPADPLQLQALLAAHHR